MNGNCATGRVMMSRPLGARLSDYMETVGMESTINQSGGGFGNENMHEM